jgi:broad specificity phosphatase PhoE
MRPHAAPPSTWPRSLWLVRHGESAGNVARDQAMASGAEMIDIAMRDVDVPLSDRGRAQAAALARWTQRRDDADRPTIVLTSPYIRAVETAAPIAATIEEPHSQTPIIDERLREKEFGALDRLTRAGITARFPAEVAMRERLGKFYYRPPSGESWCDVVQRLRGVMLELQHNYAGEHVAIVAHQVIVLCFRYLIEQLDEQKILAIDRLGDVANGSVTSYRFDATAKHGRGGLVLQAYNSTEALENEGVPVTAEPTAQPDPKAR